MNVRSVNQRPPRAPEKRRRGRPLVDDKRRIILDAALQIFADRGFHGTAVPEVAEAAGVGTGTLYRYFEHKEALVNEVYRDAKERLRAALLGGVDPPAAVAGAALDLGAAERWFAELWRRLGAFARDEPAAFRFLEMQDHAPYLDPESRRVELSVLAPLWLAGKRLRDHVAGAPIDLLIALLWGAFVGLVKAGRLGYLELDERRLEQAGAACWRMIAPAAAAAASSSALAALAPAPPPAPPRPLPPRPRARAPRRRTSRTKG